jgi:Flp pilus assembly protein CpaB
MKSRGLVVGVALVLAVVAAGAIFLYTNGVKNNAVGAGAAADVIVATKDIPANTALSPLIQKGVFKSIRVPINAVVKGAVTDTAQLQNQTSTATIFANEQIPTTRLSSGTSSTDSLGLSAGNLAISVKVSGPDGVNGAITRGSWVTVYTTFSNIRFLPGTTAQAQIQQAIKQSTGGQVATLPSLTLTLIPAARVVDIVNPPLDASGQSTGGAVTLTLDLTAKDAQNLVYAENNGTVSFGLLPASDQSGHPMPFSVVPLNRLLGRNAA